MLRKKNSIELNLENSIKALLNSNNLKTLFGELVCSEDDYVYCTLWCKYLCHLEFYKLAFNEQKIQMLKTLKYHLGYIKFVNYHLEINDIESMSLNDYQLDISKD